jgi:hypothetical protein
VQVDEPPQETPHNRLFAVGELSGLGTIDQADPFHDSTKV